MRKWFLLCVVGVVVFGCSGSSGKHKEGLKVATVSLPTAYENLSYSATVEAVGGISPYSWSYQWDPNKGQPSGIDVNQVGDNLKITGTPASGTSSNSPYPITVTVTDHSGKQASRTLWLYIEVPPLTITTTYLPEAVEGQSYSVVIEAVGGSGTYSWSYQWDPNKGQPSGIDVNQVGNNLEITGTPTSGTSSNSPYPITVTVDDGQDTVSKQFELVVLSQGSTPLQITTTTLPEAYEGQGGYNIQLQATGGVSSNYTWQIVSGSLPPNLSLDSSSGFISGNVDQNASQNSPYTFRVQVSDGVGVAEKDLTITVYPELRIITNSLPSGTVGQPYDAYVEATGGKKPYTWSNKQALPSGLQTEITQDYKLHIYGTPLQAASLDITFVVQDSANPYQQEVSKVLRIEISGGGGGQQTIELLPVADAHVNSQYPSNNYGAEETLAAGFDGYTQKIYMRFDLASSIPAGSTIVRAELILNVETISLSFPSPNPLEFYVCRASGSWDEMTITWSNAPGLGTQIGTISSLHQGTLTVPLTTSFVQDWLDNSGTNYGLVIAHAWTSGGAFMFISSRETTTAEPPKLRVMYDLPSPPPPPPPPP